ncbi:SDR family oxidoreductase [Fodinibius sediminis]|uniref:Ketoreductase domain-containing protein n=1 Tax=Fodinibius sediminis TaxID=1214077 RepID=A0A521AJ23_9BACT|nr:SDR family oxidoreductase [Fodinibius sediminis]SMO34751.1 hypothetical protein SAMN06265218_101154 [Fodinibius sediminis]
MSSFKNKNVLITGGASGIGLLMAKECIREQAAAVAIWDINESTADKLFGDEFAGSPTQLITKQVDISKAEQVTEAGKQLAGALSAVDILINNAGIVVGGPFEQLSHEQIRQTVAINLLGAMHVTRTLLPDMRRQPSGHIVNIASAAGLMPNPGMAVYAASKWGMIGWSESLRLELEEQQADIRVTTVEPSYIDTGMFAGVRPPRLTPLLDPGDIAHRIIRAVKDNRIILRAPFMVRLVPFLRGILPARAFDYVAGKLFRVYHSMDTFTGRTQKKL